jgi:O-methyltransferase domain
MRLQRLMFGHISTACVYVVAKLRIVDAADSDGLLRVDEVAAAKGLHEDALYRVLRTLAGEGLFAEEPARTFAITETGALLRDGDVSSRYMALLQGSWLPLLVHLEDSVRTGLPISVVREGRTRWEVLANDPEQSEIFNHAMRGRAAALVRALLLVDWSEAETVVDVGGGLGGTLLPLLAAQPHLRGILFDLEHVAEDARAAVASAALDDRCTIESGSFFERVPDGGDVYVLSNVLHDWYDEDALRIVQTCRAAAGPGSRLVVVENLVAAGDEPDWAKTLDILMLAAVGGRERTEKEYRALLAEAGFELEQVIGDGPVALEASPL